MKEISDVKIKGKKYIEKRRFKEEREYKVWLKGKDSQKKSIESRKVLNKNIKANIA